MTPRRASALVVTLLLPILTIAAPVRADPGTPGLRSSEAAPAPTNPVADIPADLWQAPAAVEGLTGNVLYIEGEPGRFFDDTTALATGADIGFDLIPADPAGTIGPRFMFANGPASSVRLDGTLMGTITQTHFEPGYYANLGDIEPPWIDGGISLTVNGYTCRSVNSWFAIDELTLSAGMVTHLRVRFEQTCERFYGTSHGLLDWTATPRLNGMDPVSGPRRGGTLLHLSGDDLLEPTSVTIGEVTVPVQDSNCCALTAISPALPIGTYPVTVATAGGTSPIDPDMTFTVTPDPPRAPSSVLAQAAPASVVLSWSPPDDTGDSPVTSVQVAVSEFNGFSDWWQSPRTFGPDATTVLVDGLEPEHTYRFTVTYANDAGLGDSSEVTNTATIPPPDVTPFDGVPTFVTQQYVDFAGRAPTTAERSAGVAAIRTGSTVPEAWVAAMRNRAEWGGLRAPIVRLYHACFLRRPDLGGLQFWAGRLRAGTTLTQAAASLAASSEFVHRYGSLGNRSFVTLVYQNVLDRDPDPGGLVFWVGKLDGGSSRGQVMAQLSEAAEHRRGQAATVDVSLLYTALLRRMPTTGEFDAASSSIPATGRARTVDPVGLSRTILHSPGYADRF